LTLYRFTQENNSKRTRAEKKAADEVKSRLQKVSDFGRWPFGGTGFTTRDVKPFETAGSEQRCKAGMLPLMGRMREPNLRLSLERQRKWLWSTAGHVQKRNEMGLN
jgi:hypothetical protein